jgi:multidrug efflux pump subunit AcrB
MVILITLTSMASLIPLAVGTSTQDIFGAIALATAGGTIFGTLGAMFVVPAMLLGRQRRRRSPMDVRGDFGLEDPLTS